MQSNANAPDAYLMHDKTWEMTRRDKSCFVGWLNVPFKTEFGSEKIHNAFSSIMKRCKRESYIFADNE